MLKHLLFLLLIPVLGFSQTVVQKHANHFSGNGVPTTTSTTVFVGLAFGNTYSDRNTGKIYQYKGVTTRWVEDMKIYPVGAKGDKGDTGATGAAGKDGVCPSCPPSGGGISPFNVVMDNGVDNRAALQAAIDDSYNSAKPIWIIGNNFKMSGGVIIPKGIKNLQINCSGIIVATNSNVWTLFSCPVPANVAEAEGVNTNSRYVFNNIVFHGQGKAQTMFDLQASEGCVYNNPEGKNLKLGIDNSFGLRSIISNPEWIHCTVNIKSKSAAGKYPNATAENSAPNGTVIRDGRSVADAFAEAAVQTSDCSLCEIDGYVIEGDKHGIGLDWDCSSSTSTPAFMSRIHFEGASPCGIAVVRIKSSTMTHVIDNPNMIKPSMMVEVIPTGGGYPNVKWTNVSNQRVFFDDVNPILKGAVGVGWQFENCDSPFVEYKMAKLFTGVNMTNSCVRENGLSRWCIYNKPN